MNIGIIDADLMDNGTKHPNLALMKIAGFHKDKGDKVELIFDSYNSIKEYDLVYISKVFNFTYVPEWVLGEPNIKYGGTGFYNDGGSPLPHEIEHHMPYYNLYSIYIDNMINKGKNIKNYSDYLDYSIGFLTRGCFRKCDFCVNKKYDKVLRHSYINEFLDIERPKIYLWDDNILGYSKWEEVIDELIQTEKPFQFRQGLDLRLMTDKKAQKLNSAKYYGDFIFAFDHLKEKNLIIDKIQVWKRYTNKLPKLYVLCGYESQDEKDIENTFERISILMKYGCLPYIMRHEKYNNSKYKGLYIQIARWCNQPQFYKKMSFREFCIRNQYYHNNKNTKCSAYRNMLDFEKKQLDIANKYYDLKFENENIYSFNYGYGRKYKNKYNCDICIEKNNDWLTLIESNNVDKIIRLYFMRELDLNCICYKNSKCYNNSISYNFVKLLIEYNLDNIKNILLQNKPHLKKEECYTPCYNYKYYFNFLSNLDINKMSSIKKYIIEDDITQNNLIHTLKVLALMDLIILTQPNKRGFFKLSLTGEIFNLLSKDEKLNLWNKCIYRLPLYHYYIYYGKDNAIEKLKLYGIRNYKKQILFCDIHFNTRFFST